MAEAGGAVRKKSREGVAKQANAMKMIDWATDMGHAI
jgi:hypothetical protein